MAIDFLMLGLSLRQVEGVLNLMGQSFGFDAPDHTTVRLWALRMGLYLWQRTPPKASDWIWIVDHVAQASGGKCLFIVGVRHSVIQDGNFVLKHTDVALLYREVMQSCTGDDMFTIFTMLAHRVGLPKQIVSDHGSDVLKGERLFQAKNTDVLLTWDMTHRMGRLLLGVQSEDDKWAEFKKHCQRARVKVTRTPWAALSPTSTTSATRCDHFDTLVLWAQKTLARLDGGRIGLIDSTHIWTKRANRSLRKMLSDADRGSLRELCRQSFPDAVTFRQAVVSKLGDHEQLDAIVRASDQGRRRYEKHFGWLESFRERLQTTYVPMVKMTYSAEKQVKHEGMHRESARQWLSSQSALPKSDQHARKYRARVLRYLRHEGGDHARNMAVLGTSDVLESLYGKYKRYTDRGPEATLNSSILILPIAMETLSTELITEAMERASNKSLKGWCVKTFGRTKLSIQRLLGFAKLASEPA